MAGEHGSNGHGPRESGDGEVVELPDPEDFAQMFESRYLHAIDLKGQDRVLTIKRVGLDELDDSKNKGKKKRMGVVYFAEHRKGLGLNRTNGECIKAMWGPKVQAWIGKRVGLYPTRTRAPQPTGGFAEVDCIRVRGSPDIDADVVFDLVLPKRKPTQVRLVKLVPKAAAAAQK